MEILRNQMRTKENKADIRGTKDQKISIQKTPSFKGKVSVKQLSRSSGDEKGEKKKGQSWWFQKQKTTNFYDSRETEHAVAVAAAALAINLQEASEQKSETPEASLTKSKSKLDSKKSLLASASKRLSGSFRYKDEQGEKVPVLSFRENKKPEKAIIPAPSMTNTSTFTDIKPETSASKIPPPPPPPPPPPIRQTSTKPVPLKQTPTGPNVGEAKADEWERTEFDKIRQRNEKLKEVINSWENKRKVNAKSKLIKQESELERRRLKALESFQNKMKHINQIADGARAKADENRKTEELKAREKANRIRTTGKLPLNCFCF